MPYPQFDRRRVRLEPLAKRQNKLNIETDQVPADQAPRDLDGPAQELVAEVGDRIRAARAAAKPVILACGAHTIKNGLAPVLIKLMEDGWLTHLATNGAGIIHDWEFSFQGKSSEDVRGGVERGEFGNWEETGFYVNLALNIGAFEGKGYGEAVGAFIQTDGLDVPTENELLKTIAQADTDPERAAAAADLLGVIREFELKPGRLTVEHPWKQYSAQAAAFRLGIPFTGHPMFGHDIIYNHPMNHGAALGRAAQRDFLTFADSVSRLDGGVYLSVGSAVMSPMIFEKCFSMAQNLALQAGRHIDNHYILVVDLADSHWDWQNGEPPPDNPEYYLRYNKTFSRMGGLMRYLRCDNRDFLPALRHALS